MPDRARIVGTRIPDATIAETRDVLLDWAADPNAHLGIVTAYIAPDTFDILDALVARGPSSVRVLIAANKQSRAAWEAARDYVMRPGAAQVRVVRAPVGSIMHVKLFISRSPGLCRVIVGSSNFTPGGVRGNVELNVELEDDAPLAPTSNVGALLDLFDSMFARGVVPDATILNRLIATAPARTNPTPGLGTGETVTGLPEYGAPAPAIAPEEARGPVAPDDAEAPAPTGPAPGYTTLLVQLSEADVNRPAWRATGRGTAQLNLPREAANLAGIPPVSQVQSAEAVGVGALAGTTLAVEAGFWQREARGPGLLPEAIRFTFRREYADFISEDIGSPNRGDVLVLELPSAIDEALSPIRMAVVPEAQARATGLMPTQNQRGTTDRDLMWEPRPGTVL
jgi:phospholipase D-like protein